MDWFYWNFISVGLLRVKHMLHFVKITKISIKYSTIGDIHYYNALYKLMLHKVTVNYKGKLKFKCRRKYKNFSNFNHLPLNLSLWLFQYNSFIEKFNISLTLHLNLTLNVILPFASKIDSKLSFNRESKFSRTFC